MLSRLRCRGGFAALFLAASLLASCERAPKATTPPAKQEITPTVWKEFSGEKAFEHVRKLVEFGPRPSGDKALEASRQYIIAALKEAGWTVERQEFKATPVPEKEEISFTNLIARFGDATAKSPVFILGSHYDTKRMEQFVGANDGGSSTGALIEFARAAATRPEFAKQLELVFFDGEEAIERFGDPVYGTDGLVGSRHYATDLHTSGRAKQFRGAIVWDMIGDKDLKLTLPSDTPSHLAAILLTASEQLNLRKHIGFHGGSILDDHVPLAVIARIQAMDMIDFDYDPWHTAGDTLDKLSPESLQIIGQLTMWLLEREISQ